MRKRFASIAASVVVGIALLTSAPANAQQVCLTHEAAVTQLERKFDESVAGRGLTADGKAMFELFLSETGSWTVVVSRPSGQSCVIASGESWQQLRQHPGQPAALRGH